MFKFLKRLFGGNQSTASLASPEVATPIPTATVTPPPAQSPGSSSVPVAVLQRDEMLDAKTRIAGYRLSARTPGSGLPLAGEAAISWLASFDAASFAQRRVALIALTGDDWQANDYRGLIGPNTIFLLAPPPDRAHEAWGEVAAAVRRCGAKVAAALTGLGDQLPSMATTLDYLLVDFTAYTVDKFEQMLLTVRRVAPTVGIIVDNVARWTEFRYCIAQGAAYCLGTFTTEQDEVAPSEEIGQSRLVLMEMLNQLRQDADLPRIADTAKQDPGVVLQIIALANSPLAGLSQPVTSVDQAIMVLGREQLYRWLAVGMFRIGGETSPRDGVLLELALARGRFLEVLGNDAHGKPECDELFLLGLMSLLDILLGVPLAVLVDKINLSPTLREALLNSGGPLGRYLMLAIAVEKGHAGNVARFAQALGHSAEAVEEAAVESIAWAEKAVQQAH